jgi:hypothetical protein
MPGLAMKQISDNEKVELKAEFSVEEVWVALNECDGNKAPGLDGLNLNFINVNWEFIKNDFMNFLMEFHRDGSVVKHLNRSFIALISKIRLPISIKDFRPISLVESLYKVLAKVLANRLKRVINSVIGSTQMAFVKDRQITDSFVIAEEMIHQWKKRGKGGVLVKLDFEKAYDSVDHNFLLEVMNKMGFGLRWQDWIRWCIASTSMSVLVNGSPTFQFSIGRGLGQGDPLSPFLFNLVVEVLSVMMLKEKSLDLIRGVGFGNDEVHISIYSLRMTLCFLGTKVGLYFKCQKNFKVFQIDFWLENQFS